MLCYLKSVFLFLILIACLEGLNKKLPLLRSVRGSILRNLRERRRSGRNGSNHLLQANRGGTRVKFILSSVLETMKNS